MKKRKLVAKIPGTAIVFILIGAILGASLGIANGAGAAAHEMAYRFQSTDGDAVSCNASTDGVKMLIFLSPQYSLDISIMQAIDEYIAAVKADIGWDVNLIKLADTTNSVGNIRHIIREHYYSDRIYAAMIVGEDTSTALMADTPHHEAPSIKLWAELDEPCQLFCHSNNTTVFVPPDVGIEELNTMLVGSEVSGLAHKPDVCISLIYPTAEWSYQEKRTKIIAAFEKFSCNRTMDYGSDISFLVDDSLYTSRVWKNFAALGNVTGKLGAVREDVVAAYGKKFKLLASLGHGTPRSAHVLLTDDLAFIDTPVLILGGCYTSGWFSENGTDNNILDPSISGWFGEQVLIHPQLRAAIAGNPYAGIVAYGGYDLANGKTIAEAWVDGGPLFFDDERIGQVYADQMVVYGDPTFHFPATLGPEPQTIHVPTDCPTIQDAVDAAKPGDTIYVHNGTYAENVIVNTNNLTLIGEDTSQTIVDGNYIGNVIGVAGSNVEVRNFTIRNSGSKAMHDKGMYLLSGDSCSIIGSNIVDCRVGIELNRSNNSVIHGNKVMNNDIEGLGLEKSSHNLIYANVIANNRFGITINSSNSSLIYCNNLINNMYYNAVDYSSNVWNSPEETNYTYKGKTCTGHLGNYWTDYTGIDANGDGIGDTPHSIYPNTNTDNYPLVEPFENYMIAEIEELQLSLQPGWNMVSVPLTLADNSTAAVFPDVAGVFTWNATGRSYYEPTVIDPEKGYWVAVTDDTTIAIDGTPVETWTTDIKAGWNMIGSVATNSSIADPDDEPDSSVIPPAYWWDPVTRSYSLTTDIELGKGYWIASLNDCTLTL